MPRWQRTYVVICAVATGFALAYVLCEYAIWPRLVYAPVLGEVIFKTPPIGAEELGYLGLVAWGLIGGVAAGLLALAATFVVKRPLSATALRLTGGWAITTVLFTGAFFTWSLWPF